MGVLDAAKNVAVFGIKAVGTVGLGVLDLASRAGGTPSMTKVLDDTIHNMWSEDKRKITFDSDRFANEVSNRTQVLASKQQAAAERCRQNGDYEGYSQHIEQINKLNHQQTLFELRRAAAQCRECGDEEGYRQCMEQIDRLND